MTIAQWIDRVSQMARERVTLESVEQLRRLIQQEPIAGSDEQIEIIRELAYDLEYFEPDPRVRAEDPSFVDETRARQAIEAAAARLRKSIT